MIFKGIELFDVAEVTYDEAHAGYQFHRLPLAVEEKLGAGGKRMNSDATGIELRFVMKSDTVTLRMQVLPYSGDAFVDGQQVNVYFGNQMGGWQDQEVNRIVYRQPTDIVIHRPPEMPTYREFAEKFGYPYDCEVVRVILQPAEYRLIDVIGDCEPPKPEQLPGNRYLAYGSSITHGSLALNLIHTFVSRVGAEFKAETRNLGYSGAACLEPEMADAIAAQDFSFATLEMGINILGIPCDDFAARVKYMIRTVASAHPDAPIFCVSPFYCINDYRGDPKPDQFRRVVADAVRECGFANVHEINGLSCLGAADGLSGDLIHPSVVGVDRIARSLIEQMRPVLQKAGIVR